MRNPAVCNNGEVLGGHHAKWDKPDRKTNIAWSTCEILNKNKTKPSENRMDVD